MGWRGSWATHNRRFFKARDWTVKYAVTDSFGITTTAERQVRIFDPVAPVITLNGEAMVLHELATEYSDLGATVADADGNVLDAELIKLTGVVDGGAAGTYTLAYDFTDAEGRPAETVFRTVQVSDTTPPVLTIHGGSSILHPIGNPILTLARWRWMQQMVRFPQQVISTSGIL